jgi:hypothetical protein
MHYLDFSAERFLPPISKLLDQPFWLDPSDPHRMAAAMQVVSRPLVHNYAVASGNWRHDVVEQEHVWAKAIHRIVTEGVSPEQAVDDAIARVKSKSSWRSDGLQRLVPALVALALPPRAADLVVWWEIGACLTSSSAS